MQRDRNISNVCPNAPYIPEHGKKFFGCIQNVVKEKADKKSYLKEEDDTQVKDLVKVPINIRAIAFSNENIGNQMNSELTTIATPRANCTQTQAEPAALAVNTVFYRIRV